MLLPQTLRRQPPWLVVLEALSLVAIIGWVDYVTGWEWSFFIFYAAPIVLVVWKIGRRAGFVFAVLCSATWWAAQIDSSPYHTMTGFLLAVANRLFYFVVLVVAASLVKSQREMDAARIASLEREQEFEHEILRTSEQEKQRIGRDLHDGLGPHLAAIGYATSFLVDDLRQRNAPEVAKAEQICGLVGDAVALTRALARGIFPVQMDGSGLAMALEDMARTMSKLAGVSITFCESGNPQVEVPEDGMNIFRIAQEAVNNALKHGRAENVTIILSKTDGTMRLAVADDGTGMASVPEDARGIGLHSMKYRARALGGEIEIKSTPGDGTIVSCEIPVRPAIPKPVQP